MLDRRTVRSALVEQDTTLAAACREAELPYYRVLRALNGYSKPLEEEEAERLRSVLGLDVPASQKAADGN